MKAKFTGENFLFTTSNVVIFSPSARVESNGRRVGPGNVTSTAKPATSFIKNLNFNHFVLKTA